MRLAHTHTQVHNTRAAQMIIVLSRIIYACNFRVGAASIIIGIRDRGLRDKAGENNTRLYIALKNHPLANEFSRERERELLINFSICGRETFGGSLCTIFGDIQGRELDA